MKILGETLIEVNNVGMEFDLSEERTDNFKEYFIKFLKRELKHKEFWALRNISFTVKRGEKVGIIGSNGAGKSTLLKLISGVLMPTEGEIILNGELIPLLELGSGFDGDYTGRENIFLNGSLLGYSKKYLESKYDEIVEFSEIWDFIDVPTKNYSSGMKARLAFSIATTVQPEILILDEVLSVGDTKFQEKSRKRIESLLDGQVTLLFVSHSIDQVKKMCNKAVWIEKGKMIMQGKAEDVCDAYAKAMHSKAPFIKSSDPTDNSKNVSPNKVIEITFSGAIKTGNNWIELKDGNDKIIPITKTISGDKLIITPVNPLINRIEYVVLIHTGSITNLSGNGINGCKISFTVE